VCTRWVCQVRGCPSTGEVSTMGVAVAALGLGVVVVGGLCVGVVVVGCGD
jgi:hypothetical protein